MAKGGQHGKGKGSKGGKSKGGRGAGRGGPGCDNAEDDEHTAGENVDVDQDEQEEDDVDDGEEGEVATKKKKKGGGFQSMELSYPVYSGIMKMGYKAVILLCPTACVLCPRPCALALVTAVVAVMLARWFPARIRLVIRLMQ